MTKNKFTLLVLILLSSYTSSSAQCVTCDECDIAQTTIIGDTFLTGFSNGLAFGDANAIGLLTGANNAFGGSIWNLNTVVAGMASENLCIYGNFDVTAEDPIAYPITIEFRLENNNCGFDPCPQTRFNTVVNSDGTITIQELFAVGTAGPNGAFDPAGVNPSIVAAIANFSGTPMPAGVTVSFSNIVLNETVCVQHPVPPPGCIDAVSGGGTDGSGGQGGIPTVGEWGIVCLTILCLTLGLVFIRSESPILEAE